MLDLDECISAVLEGSLDLRAEKPVLSEEPPPFCHPAGKLVTEHLMVFNFNMHTRCFIEYVRLCE